MYSVRGKKREDGPLEKKYIFIPRLGTKRSLYFCIWKGMWGKYSVSILLLHDDDYNASKCFVVLL